MKEEELEQSIIDVIAKSESLGILSDVAELTLDQLLDDGIVKDIPVFGTLAKLYKAGIGVKNFLFARKLQRFLSAISSVPPNERQAFTQRLEDDKPLRKQVGETLLLILDRLDDMRKPDLVARAFVAYLKKEIDFASFQRMSSVIDRCFLPDLNSIRGKVSQEKFAPHVAMSLTACGLLELERFGPGDDALYLVTQFGKSFARVVLTEGTN